MRGLRCAIDLIGAAFGGGMDNEVRLPAGKGRAYGCVVGQIEAVKRRPSSRMRRSNQIFGGAGQGGKLRHQCAPEQAGGASQQDFHAITLA